MLKQKQRCKPGDLILKNLFVEFITDVPPCCKLVICKQFNEEILQNVTM
jgi:hypothetical protein